MKITEWFKSFCIHEWEKKGQQFAGTDLDLGYTKMEYYKCRKCSKRKFIKI